MASTAGSAVIVGMGVTGRAVLRHLHDRGWSVVVIDDQASPGSVDEAGRPGPIMGSESAVEGADMVVPSPGVRPDHAALVRALAAGVPVVSEVELAWRSMGAKRLVAITGTNGKTTVVTMVTAMLELSGCPAVAAGNIGLPLIKAVQADARTVVAELSSFQLHWTASLRPDVGTWLNFAPDHLDWHPTLEHYAAAKARIWAEQTEADVAVANVDDPTVTSAAEKVRSRVVTFGARGQADFRVEDEALCGPGGSILPVGHLRRSLPHDVANALAATATATAAGAETEACAAILAEWEGLPHRVQLVGDSLGVKWYDDSKATTPAAVLAALEGFDSAVLIAGGRNKGLDLSVLRTAAHRLRAVVAIGEAAEEVEAAFKGQVRVTRATDMAAAVEAAADAARAGDAVLLSPACASQDWYADYHERGEDFTREVRKRSGDG